ncbi:MAG: GNAT family N-acetyltransferase [Bacteroidia bacterium]|nr:GNAT family N-acetyltransferase [Bacteroidia bacterium]RZV57602.1 MAG: GNAT family N-acetyltransferase [Flavobacteriaceae bacterium]
MDYHNDRFHDHSILVYKKGEIVAIFPANELNETVYSHQGLSYGGLVLKQTIDLYDVIAVFKELLEYYSKNAIKEIEIKLLPRMYHVLPSDEIDYILFKLGAKCIRKDVAFTIDNSNKLAVTSSNRIRGLKKATKQGVIVNEEDHFDSFWNEILIPNLKLTHDVSPVHSIEEITSLKEKFPNNIRQFNAYLDDDIVAGVTIFETKNVAHAQYISADKNRQEHAGLDLIFDHLINNVFSDKPYFDFGISSEQDGKFINQGLSQWKESFGGRSVVHDFYHIETSTSIKLEDIFK